jgi:hypothetical protein
MSLLKHIQLIPNGYSEVLYQQKKYGVSRTDFNSGKSIKVYAKELGGNDFISMNYYITSTSESLRPCEMPKKKVIHFMKNIELI